MREFYNITNEFIEGIYCMDRQLLNLFDYDLQIKQITIISPLEVAKKHFI